jgi:DNA polymerase III subunit chi
MAEVWFYHLEQRTVEQELPGLLQRGLERNLRMAVYVPDEKRAQTLSQSIWAYEDVAFIPHGFQDDADAQSQPVLICFGGSPANAARFAFCIDGSEVSSTALERVSILFDGRDQARVSDAREQWKRFKAEGAVIKYWKQDEAGRWKDQAAH